MTGRPVILGLTGSIGMGKSTTAAMFADLGVPVWDADAAVHRLYAADGAGTRALASLFPRAVGSAGVDRAALRQCIAEDPGALARLESVVHPLVAADRQRFLDDAASRGIPLVVLDVPLLFETGGDARCDATVVVSVPEEMQRARVLARPGMTESDLARLLSRQMPDAEKRARASHVIETSTLDGARKAVQQIVESYGGGRNARDRS